MTEDIETIKAIASDSKARINRIVDNYEELEKENAELEKEISVLLSCANCSENKGGYICDKEYNDKCLAQKIEYIKELNDENAELKKQIEKMKSDVQKLSNNKYYYLSQDTCKELLRRWN